MQHPTGSEKLMKRKGIITSKLTKAVGGIFESVRNCSLSLASDSFSGFSRSWASMPGSLLAGIFFLDRLLSEVDSVWNRRTKYSVHSGVDYAKNVLLVCGIYLPFQGFSAFPADVECCFETADVDFAWIPCGETFSAAIVAMDTIEGMWITSRDKSMQESHLSWQNVPWGMLAALQSCTGCSQDSRRHSVTWTSVLRGSVKQPPFGSIRSISFGSHSVECIISPSVSYALACPTAPQCSAFGCSTVRLPLWLQLLSALYQRCFQPAPDEYS